MEFDKDVWGTSLLILGSTYVISKYIYTIDLVFVLASINLVFGTISLYSFRKGKKKTSFLFISLFTIVSVVFLFSVDYVLIIYLKIITKRELKQLWVWWMILEEQSIM